MHVGYLTALFGRPTDVRSSLSEVALLQMLRGDGDTPVTPASSLRLAVVFSCTRVLAESLAMLPLELMQQDGRNRQPATGHPLYSILKLLPNPEMTSAEVRMTAMGHLATWGNAYLQIIYDNAGRRRELWPLRPDRMEVRRSQAGELEYVYQRDAGQLIFAAWEIMHVRGLSPDGLVGYSPVALARRTFERKAEMEQYEQAFYANSARPDLVLKYPKALSDKARANVLESWEGRHQGPGRAGRAALLEEGLDVTTVGIPQTDAQFLESQKFTRSEIAALFRVPLHMINDLDRATFSNIEEQAQEFIDYTLGPWLVLWQQAISRDLLTPSERGRYYAHFKTQALLRGNHAARAAFYSSMVQLGALSPNDVRELEDLNPVPNGDQYLVPLNMQPLGDVGKETGSEPPASADQASRSAADVMTPLLADVARRITSRIANDVQSRGAKELRKGGRAGLDAWLTERAPLEWRLALAEMLEPARAVAGVTGYRIDEVALEGWLDDALNMALSNLLSEAPHAE